MQKRLFHIVRFNNVSRPDQQSAYLKSACDQDGIDYVLVDVDKTGPIDLLSINIVSQDIVYRSAQGKKAKKIEQYLGLQAGYTIYHDKEKSLLLGKGNSYLAMQRAGLPVIPSVPFIPRSKKGLQDVVAYLGNFPLVIKVFGGYEGVGVMRVDSTESFNSVADFLRKDERSSVMIMQYIPHNMYARLVVVGDKVVAATSDIAPLGDFRANALGPREHRGEVHNPNPEVTALAISAVKAMGLSCGGVDVIYGDDDKLYLAEVNSPFNFAETQERTGVNIALEILREITK